MGIIPPIIDRPIPPGETQDKILNAVTDEITNKGFVIASADKVFNGRVQAHYGP